MFLEVEKSCGEAVYNSRSHKCCRGEIIKLKKDLCSDEGKKDGRERRKENGKDPKMRISRKKMTFFGHALGGGGGGGTPIYLLYGYVPLERVWFSSHLVWYRV